MELDKQKVQEVFDLFDIKYSEKDGETESSDGQPSNFSEVADGLSDVMTSMEHKGKILEQEESEKSGETENNLESIEDLIADSVEEAKALTAQQFSEEKKVLEEEFLFEGDEILVDPDFSDDVEGDEQDVDDLKEVDSATVLTEEDVEVIPRKDSEGNVKGHVRMVDVVNSYVDTKGETIVQGGIILWGTESPSELYNEFYEIKREHINKFSGGQQLNFAKLYQELYDAKVDTSTEVLDPKILMKKMDDVMKCIERVAMIQVQINQQAYVWKRFVELLRGALARVQYLKPVLKQDGLILEHMGDVEFYSDRLQAIKDSAHDVMKTLDKAFETLSRKVTVMLTLQGKNTIRMSSSAYGGDSQSYSYQEPVETVVSNNETVETIVSNKEPELPAEDLSDYDGFDIGTKVVATKPKSGQVDWGEVW